MGRVKHTTLALTTLLFSNFAAASYQDWDVGRVDIQPTVGIDVGLHHQRFQNQFGQDQFHENYPATNIYIGARLHRYFGVEAGYEHMYRLTDRQYYEAGKPVLGFTPPAGDISQRLYFADLSANGWNFNLQGFWPLCDKTGTELMASVGMNWAKVFYSVSAITDQNAASDYTKWQSSRKGEWRFGVGIRQMITKHFGSRLQVLWQESSRLNASAEVPSQLNGDNQGGVQAYTVNPRGLGYVVNLGFFFQLT